MIRSIPTSSWLALNCLSEYPVFRKEASIQTNEQSLRRMFQPRRDSVLGAMILFSTTQDSVTGTNIIRIGLYLKTGLFNQSC